MFFKVVFVCINFGHFPGMRTDDEEALYAPGNGF